MTATQIEHQSQRFLYHGYPPANSSSGSRIIDGVHTSPSTWSLSDCSVNKLTITANANENRKTIPARLNSFICQPSLTSAICNVYGRMNNGKHMASVQNAAFAVIRFQSTASMKTEATGPAKKNQHFWKNSNIVGNFPTTGAHKPPRIRTVVLQVRPTEISFLSDTSVLIL